HYKTENEQGEPEENFQEAFRLLQTPNQHGPRPPHPFRCAVHISDAKTFQPVCCHRTYRSIAVKHSRKRRIPGEARCYHFPAIPLVGIFRLVRDEKMDLLTVRLQI